MVILGLLNLDVGLPKSLTTILLKSLMSIYEYHNKKYRLWDKILFVIVRIKVLKWIIIRLKIVSLINECNIWGYRKNKIKLDETGTEYMWDDNQKLILDH